MVYVMFDDSSVAECATVEEGRETARTLAASEPFSGNWWLADAEGEEIEHLGFGRGWFA